MENRRLLEPIDIHLPGLASEIDGLRIGHVSDLHADVPRRHHRAVIEALRSADMDLVVLTGDYMTRRGRETNPSELVREICRHVAPPHGIYGVYGNHDSAVLSEELKPLPIQWLINRAAAPTALPLEILGLDFLNFGRCDAPALLPDRAAASGAALPRRTTILLCHFPNYLPIASDMGVDLMLCGHTHGGQCRLPGGRALINSTDLPLRLTSGLLRHRDTLCVVSRGLGEVHMPMRVFCPRHIPIVTLRRGPLPGAATNGIVNLRRW